MTPMMLSTAEYLEQSAKPAHTPAPSHHPQEVRRLPPRAAIKQPVAPSRAATSGPSGSTHVASLIPNTGAKFSTTAADKPAAGPKRADVTRYISQVVRAKSAMNGNRTTTALSLPVRCAAAHAIHHEIGGWSK